jgi:hypothetical protein
MCIIPRKFEDCIDHCAAMCVRLRYLVSLYEYVCQVSNGAPECPRAFQYLQSYTAIVGRWTEWNCATASKKWLSHSHITDSDGI